jgi:hypothetical protein
MFLFGSQVFYAWMGMECWVSVVPVEMISWVVLADKIYKHFGQILRALVYLHLDGKLVAKFVSTLLLE